MMRCGVLGLLLVIGLAGTLVAKPGVVKTRDGQTYEGEVDEKDPSVVIVVVKGIQTRIERGQIESIAYPADKSKDLEARLAKLGPRDVAGRVALAREAMNQEQYTVARDILAQAQLIDPNNAEVVSLLETVQSQIRMERTRQRPAEGARPVTEPSATQVSVGDIKLLRPADINAIRQAELRFDDANVRIRFEHNVLRRFVDYYGRERAPNFYSLNPMQQAALILEKGPPEMAQDMIIVNDPPAGALAQYRRVVQPFVVLNCATSACHGGNETKFKLVTPADSDAASFTNFYILSKYVKPGANVSETVFSGGNPRMVDRQRPEQSLLIQYALPGSIAQHDHPEVLNYRPPLRGLSDVRYGQLLTWVGLLKPVEPQYAFDAPPATQPATTQAAPATANAPATPNAPPPNAPVPPRRPVVPPPPPAR